MTIRTNWSRFMKHRQAPRAGQLVRPGRILALASVLAVTPMITGLPQVSSPVQAHPVKTHVRGVALVKSQVAALRTARDATRSAVSADEAVDPITTARAAAMTPVQDVAGAVTVVGVTWPKGSNAATATYQIRTLTGPAWSQWVTLSVNDGGPDSAEAAAAATLGTSPYVITGASKYEVRSLTTDPQIPAAATVQVVDPGSSGADNVTQEPGAAAAATTAPAILTRSDWGADETLRRGVPIYGQVQVGFVHHTADDSNPLTANSYAAADVPAMIRGMYAYHVQSLLWDDIGYNFLIDRFGRTWEGRYGGTDKAVVGAQTYGYNSTSTGAAVIGNYDIAPVPQVVTDAFSRVLAWKLSLAGVPASGLSPLLGLDGTSYLPRVSGHRDAFATICPGQYLYAVLPEIRAGADALIGSLPNMPTGVAATGGNAQATVSWAAPASAGGSAITGYTVTASPGGKTLSTTAAARTAAISGLSNGTAYTFTVTAANPAGTSLGSAPSAPVTPRAPAAAVTRLSDFDKTGSSDLVARDNAGVLWLYPGNGSGSYVTRRRIGGGWNVMTAIVTPGDLTGDGNADILARDTAGSLWLYPGNGASALLTRRRISGGWGSYTITNAADLNRAGQPDLLARDSAGVLWLYPFSGNGVMGARTRISGGWNGYTFRGPGDLSGDGRADILARDAAGTLWLYRGTGTGGVAARSLVGNGWAGMSALVTPGDWNRTGGNDALARDSAGRMWLYPGNGGGLFGTRTQIGSGWQGFNYIG
jgi:hypothetical protein